MAGLYPSADEEARVGAVAALRNLAQAAAQPNVPLDEEDLSELVVAALRLGIAAEDVEDEDSMALLDVLEPLSGRLNENSEAVVAKVRAELAAFRFAALFWDEVCSGLGPFHPAPYAVREAAEAFLESLDVLSRSLIMIHRWIWRKNPRKNPTYKWLDDLRGGLEEAITDAIGRIQDSRTRERLWPLHDRARELELGDLFPSLTALLAGRANELSAQEAQEDQSSKLKAQSTKFLPISYELSAMSYRLKSGTARSFEELLKGDISSLENQSEWADSLVMDIMRLAEQGHLSRSDMEAARKALAEAPARWAAAHREALRRDGLKAPVFLVQNDQGIMTAPAVLRVTPEEVKEALRLRSGQALASSPGSSQAALTAGSERPSTPALLQRHGSSLPALLDDIPVEGFALASRELHLAGVRLLLFGDDQSLWCTVWGNVEPEGRGTETQVNGNILAYKVGKELYGDIVSFPLFQAGEEYGSYEIKKFRPGPIRAWLRSRYPNIDRAYSPRAFVITVGESLLRNLLGWKPGGESTQRMNGAAWEAGIHFYSELRSVLIDTCDGALPRWIREMETTQEVCKHIGVSTLGELADSWSILPPEKLDEQQQQLGAEIDTLMSLQEGGPVDGDIFVLIPTETATSILCALLIGRWLHERFPHSDLRITPPCEALKQRERLRQSDDGEFESKHDLSMDALGRTLNPVVKELLVDDAADPTFLISGGVKWVTLPMLEMSRDRRVACVYKFEPIWGKEVAPVVFRWDTMGAEYRSERVEPKRDALPMGRPELEICEAEEVSEPKTGKPCMVASVGTSLLGKYRDEKKRLKARACPGALKSGDDRVQAKDKAGDDRVEAKDLVEWIREMSEDEQWRSCAELTGVKAWRELIHADASGIAVALIQTSSEDGRVCGEAIEVLLKEQGADALRRTEWEVLELSDITDASGKEQVLQIFRRILSPVGQCLDDLARGGMQPDVLLMGGQTLTAAMIQIVAANKGYRVFLAPEAAEGKMPTLWPFPTVPAGPDLPIPIRDVGSAWD